MVDCIPCNMRPHRQGEAFWGNPGVRTHPNSILTIDHDSKLLAQVVQLMMFYPEIEELATIRSSRHLTTTLFSALDISFWRKREAASKSLHLVDRVSIGHGELLVKSPDVNLQTFHQFMTDFQRDGVPQECCV